MHTMLKRTLFFLAGAVVTGALSFSNLIPMLNQTFQGLSLLSAVLIMFFAIAYSLRGENYKT